METKGGETFSIHILLDFLSLCESSGFIQLNLPFPELKEKLVDLWSEVFSPPCSGTTDTVTATSSNAMPPAQHVSEDSEKDDGRLCGKEVEEKGREVGNERVGGEKEGREVRDGSLGGEEVGEEVRDGRLASEEVEEEGKEVRDGRMGGEEGRDMEDLNWTILTPDISYVSEQEEESWMLGSKEERDGMETEKEVARVEEGSIAEAPVCSAAFTQPHFDSLSATSNAEENTSSSATSPSLLPQSPSPSHAPTMSSHPDTTSGSLTSNNIADTVKTEPYLIDRSSSVSLSCSPPSCPPSNCVEKSVVVVLDSSDDEADTKLEDLFANMRLQSTKKKKRAQIPSRKSLSAFIVSDSDVESDGGNCTVEAPEDTSSCFQTPARPLSHCKIPPTPFTPYTALVFWGSPGENSFEPPNPCQERHCVTAPPPTNRQTLTEKNHSPYTPGIPAKVRGSQPPLTTTPSAHKTFSRHKKTMAQELFSLFNCTVFDNELPADMELSWNSKLRTTAGYCRNSGTLHNRQSRIELSIKVIDSYKRLKNTLIHEMCHAAVWVINGVKNGGHRRHWQAWALKANTTHPDLDTITRCHNYDISYKYSYKCTRCDYKLGRHSKSVNLTTSRCPFCLSHLELEPRLNPDGTPAGVKLNRYAQYVKEHYAEVKQRTPLGGHKAVMQKLREQYYSSKRIPALGSFPKE